MRVNEIFYSLQGEGRWTGTPAIFIRFSGCNLKCDFCDTKHQTYKEYTEEEIMREIAKFEPCKHIVITGGEPSLQLTDSFIDLLVEHGYYVAVETNGTRQLPVGIRWVTCSPKFEFCPKAEVKLDWIDELKVVYRGKGQDMTKYDDIEAMEYYLQPCDTGNPTENRRVINETIEYIKQNPKWKLSLQTQKILGVR